jgi:predicted RNase H-like nuclease (RuvC/YqgF family)
LAITRLKEEYDKLNSLLKESRKNESMLVKKCKDMAAEVNANARKIQTAVKLSQSDRATIAALQKEVKKAWKQVETNSEKESKNKDIIASLRSELDSLKGTSQKGPSEAPVQVPLGTGLARHKLLELQMEQEEQLRQLTKVHMYLQ